MVSEKNISMLPEPSNIEAVALDELIPDPLPDMNKNVALSVMLSEGCFLEFLLARPLRLNLLSFHFRRGMAHA
jgi:hypothetical protein